MFGCELKKNSEIRTTKAPPQKTWWLKKEHESLSLIAIFFPKKIPGGVFGSNPALKRPPVCSEAGEACQGPWLEILSLLVFKERLLEKLWDSCFRGFFFPGQEKNRVISIHSFPTHSWYQRCLGVIWKICTVLMSSAPKPRILVCHGSYVFFSRKKGSTFSNDSHSQVPQVIPSFLTAFRASFLAPQTLGTPRSQRSRSQQAQKLRNREFVKRASLGQPSSASACLVVSTKKRIILMIQWNWGGSF